MFEYLILQIADNFRLLFEYLRYGIAFKDLLQKYYLQCASLRHNSTIPASHYVEM